MGIETVLIDGVPYSPLAISNFAPADEMYDNMGSIRSSSITDDDPRYWDLPKMITVDARVYLVNGDCDYLREEVAVPEEIVAAFAALKATKLPLLLGRQRKIEELRRQAGALLADPVLDDLFANAKATLLERRDTHERLWMEQLRSIPLVRLEVEEGTPLVVMPPLVNLIAT